VRKRYALLSVFLCLLAFLCACKKSAKEERIPAAKAKSTKPEEKRVQATPKTWSLEQLHVLEGFSVPECVAPDPRQRRIYISNIHAEEGEYWEDNGKGFISEATYDGELLHLRWKESSEERPIHAPKGMCVSSDHLYINDNTRILVTTTRRLDEVSVVEELSGQRLNDLAADGPRLLISDTAAGIVYLVDENANIIEIPAPETVNGVTFHKDRIFAVSWDHPDLYELDPKGKEAPRSFGLTEHFSNLDGIEVLEDGTFLVSDFTGNKISAVSPDEKSVRTLVEIETPADFGLDEKEGLLFVPQFMKDRVVIFKLSGA